MAIKVFIGSEPKTEIAKKVLEFSILQRTKTKVVFPGLDSSDNWIQREQAEYKGVGTG
ncbi:MAG: hypothetical protein GTO02_21500, partial [Candidatus Dadabacteria bacterium]|nr:hypothetical protein [Candidatus Dadabacteria bacterium]